MSSLVTAWIAPMSEREARTGRIGMCGDEVVGAMAKSLVDQRAAAPNGLVEPKQMARRVLRAALEAGVPKGGGDPREIMTMELKERVFDRLLSAAYGDEDDE